MTKPAHKLGVAIAMFCVLLNAAQAVYVGHIVQGVDPVVVLAVCVAIAMVFFNAMQLRGREAYMRALRNNFRLVAWLNVLTIGSWAGSFAALRFVEPAVSQSAVIGIAPLATIAFSRLIRRASAASLRSDLFASIGMFVVAMVQVAEVWQGKTAVGDVPTSRTIAGLACIAINGLSNGAIQVVNKRLAEAGMPSSQVVASRFFLVVLAGAIYVAVAQPAMQPLIDNLPGVIAVACFGVVGFIYLLQRAIELTEPVTVALIAALVPACVLALQSFDRRLHLSVLSLITVATMVALVVWSTYHRLRKPK